MKKNLYFSSYLVQFFLEWKIFQTCYIEKQNTQFKFYNFFVEYRAFYEVMWKNTVQPGRPQMTIWLMRIAFWIP